MSEFGKGAKGISPEFNGIDFQRNEEIRRRFFRNYLHKFQKNIDTGKIICYIPGSQVKGIFATCLFYSNARCCSQRRCLP
jgi:CRISPR/Cas system CSM-associated protein Csm5 (group 7 of RAMP superfamily)